MKVIILAGGYGTRISEETHLKPKPMIEIGGKPILWHIMKIYSFYGINEFIVCLGYKGYVIKEYFSNYFLHTSDVTFDMQSNKMYFHQSTAETTEHLLKLFMISVFCHFLIVWKPILLKSIIPTLSIVCYRDCIFKCPIGRLLGLLLIVTLTKTLLSQRGAQIESITYIT